MTTHYEIEFTDGDVKRWMKLYLRYEDPTVATTEAQRIHDACPQYQHRVVKVTREPLAIAQEMEDKAVVCPQCANRMEFYTLVHLSFSEPPQEYKCCKCGRMFQVGIMPDSTPSFTVPRG